MTKARCGVRLDRQAHADAVEAGRRASPRETGGILMGHYLAGEVVVTALLEVPDPAATRARYQRDAELAEQVLRQHGESGADHDGYVGEWHTHPAPLGPSPLDRLALRRLAAASDLPLVLVVISYRAARHHHTHVLVRDGVTRRVTGAPSVETREG